jgi:exosome complex RNA-binding protein Rrp42 (RNase PH superfamily)
MYYCFFKKKMKSFSTIQFCSSHRTAQSQAAIARIVESSLKDSDAIDTESLCIIANEKVG